MTTPKPSLREALERIVQALNDPHLGFVDTIEQVHAMARAALAESESPALPDSREGLDPPALDVERLARHLQTWMASSLVVIEDEEAFAFAAKYEYEAMKRSNR